MNISYIPQYTFNDCIYRLPLRFDFAIFNNSKLLYLIEYDGKQHCEPVDYFGGQDGFELTKKRDSIKNEYCKHNNIDLIRIPFFEFKNIDNILTDYLNKYEIDTNNKDIIFFILIVFFLSVKTQIIFYFITFVDKINILYIK